MMGYGISPSQPIIGWTPQTGWLSTSTARKNVALFVLKNLQPWKWTWPDFRWCCTWHLHSTSVHWSLSRKHDMCVVTVISGCDHNVDIGSFKRTWHCPIEQLWNILMMPASPSLTLSSAALPGDCYANVADQLCSKSGVASVKQQLERAGQADAWHWLWEKPKSPVDRCFIPSFIGFHPSDWWCRISQPSTVWKINIESVFNRFIHGTSVELLESS